MYIEGCSEDSCICSFLSILDTLFFVYWSCDHLTYIVHIFGLYIYIDVCYFTYLSMYCFFSLFIHMFLI